MSKFKAFLKKKDITVTRQTYGIEALGAMAQGLFCSLLIGTIIKTLGTQLGVQFITDIGTYAMAVSGPAMAVAIGYALKSPPMVLARGGRLGGKRRGRRGRPARGADNRHRRG